MPVRLQFFLYLMAPLLAFTTLAIVVHFRKSWPKWLKTANLAAVVAAVFIPYSTFVVILPMLLLNGWFWTRLNDKDGTKPWAFIQNDATYIIIAIAGVLAAAYWWVDSLEAILLLTILTLVGLYGARTYLARKSREDTPTSLLSLRIRSQIEKRFVAERGIVSNARVSSAMHVHHEQVTTANGPQVTTTNREYTTTSHRTSFRIGNTPISADTDLQLSDGDLVTVVGTRNMNKVYVVNNHTTGYIYTVRGRRPGVWLLILGAVLVVFFSYHFHINWVEFVCSDGLHILPPYTPHCSTLYAEDYTARLTQALLAAALATTGLIPLLIYWWRLLVWKAVHEVLTVKKMTDDLLGVVYR